MSAAHFFHFDEKGIRTEYATIDEALKARERDGFVWFTYAAPERDELSRIMKNLPIHPLSIEDCFDMDQIPKIDIFPEYTSILFNDFSFHGNEILISEINLFLGNDFLVTVTREETDAHYPLETILEELEQDIAFSATHSHQGPSYVMHIILDHIVDAKFHAVESVEDEIIAFEDCIVSGNRAINLGELQCARRKLIDMRKSLFHEREIFARMCRRDSKFIPESAIIFYSDIYDHLTKFVETVETNREMVTSLVQMNLSISNNAMTEAANRTNRSVSRLTLITTIFMPLTLIAGIGGMSEWSMMTGPDNWKISYPILLGIMTVVGVINFIVLKWIDRK